MVGEGRLIVDLDRVLVELLVSVLVGDREAHRTNRPSSPKRL